MPLPGHLWSVRDQYGAMWNHEPFPTYVQIWYYRRKLVRDFPEFQFSLVMAQRDPSRPLPQYYTPLGGEKDESNEKEDISPQLITRDPIAHEEEDF